MHWNLSHSCDTQGVEVEVREWKWKPAARAASQFGNSAMLSKAVTIIAAVGPDCLRAYIRQERHNPAFVNILQTFSPEILALGYYTVENAEAWWEVDKFLRWLGHKAQNSAATQPGTPTSPSTSYKPPHLNSPHR
ncbi:hypothetical protein C8R45DRAFT_923033 [Mycena sanguinolenta]|nr:hypothetical protein C8R45DRAFT_923033 [Mycena sanguinolenta]